MIKILVYLIIILWGFHTIKFIFELISEKIKNSQEIFSRSFYAIIFILISLAFILDGVWKNFEFINKYTIILLYFAMHLMLTCFIYVISMIIPFILIFLDWILQSLKSLIFGAVSMIEGILKNTKDISKINIRIYRFYTFVKKKFGHYNEISFKNINWIKFAKNLFIISYLISGLIVLSPLNNIMLNEMPEKYYKTKIHDIVKSDYELYKQVFVISLIPFSLRYIFKSNGNIKSVNNNK